MREPTQKKQSQWKMLIRLLNIAKDQKKNILLAVFLTVFQSLFTALQPYLYKVIIDEVILAEQYQWLGTACSILLGWLFFQALIGFYNSYLAAKIAQSVILKLRQYVYDHLIRLKLSFFDKTPVGTAVTRSVSDIQTITDLFSAGIITILGDLIQIIAILSCMFYINVKLTLLTISVVPILLYAANIFRKGIRDTFQEVRNQVSNLNAFLQERITGMQIVQLFNQQQREYKKFKAINTKHRDANIRSVLYYSIFFPVVEVLVALSFAIIISYGSILMFDLKIQLGEITAFIMFVNLFFRPIRAIADRFNNIQMGIVASERIFNLIDAEEHIERTGIQTPNSLKGLVEFDQVWFAYKSEDWILKNISFTVEAGKSLALVGATGSGKTTIASLITHLYLPQKGEIRIDHTPIDEYEISSLRKRIAFVLQDVFLFSGSIRNNLVLKSTDISADRMIRVAREIGAYEFIDALPGGFDYHVQERGMSLSQGQRQLISFIRALAVDPDIIVLDEATSAIDSQTEHLIQKAIELLLKDRTAVVIAHRLSTIKHCNEIMVLEKGEILEKGTHQELMKEKGAYQHLYSTQIESVQ
ncbi:MAG: ABC transporter ATP-binding protein [Bacteroidia bacterium]|nr:ABC transporter ATP-binding protein [Bacteroidia bacterium]